MPRKDLPLSVLLRLPDEPGCFCCVQVEPDLARSDLRPGRPWWNIAEGDEVLLDGQTRYVVERIIPLEAPGRLDPEAVAARRRERNSALMALAGNAPRWAAREPSFAPAH